jgi:hypothetical protein
LASSGFSFDTSLILIPLSFRLASSHNSSQLLPTSHTHSLKQVLPLKEEFDEDFIFLPSRCKADSVTIAHELKLLLKSVRYEMKKGGEITGTAKVVKLYTIRDRMAKGLNESCKC